MTCLCHRGRSGIMRWRGLAGPLMKAMESEIANATLKALRRVLRATDGGTRRLAAATGLTPSQLLVLREIDTGEGVTPGLIARRLQLDRKSTRLNSSH